MTSHRSKNSWGRFCFRLGVVLLVVAWQERGLAADGEAPPGNDCSSLPAREDPEERENALRECVRQNKGPATGAPTPASIATGSSNPATATKRPASKRTPVPAASAKGTAPPKEKGKRQPAGPPSVVAPTTPSSSPTVLVYSGPPLVTLEAWASEAIGKRDSLERERNEAGDPAKRQQIELELELRTLEALRMVGLVLTIAGNCKSSEPQHGRASCLEAKALSERVLERWVGMKGFKRLAEELKAQGWADWQASVILALAAEAHADNRGLVRRLTEVKDSLTDEKVRTIIDDLLPAAQKGFPELRKKLELVPQLQRVEVMLLVLRAALPGARKRPEAHVVLLERNLRQLRPAEAEAKRQFLFALKQVLTATTGTDVCDGTLPGKGCVADSWSKDAELTLEFVPAHDSLGITADLQLTERWKQGVSTPRQATQVAIALGASPDKCAGDEVASRAVTAAWALMKELEWSYNNILGDVPHLGIGKRELGQPLHPGVKVIELSASSALVPRDSLVRLVGKCEPAPFVDKFKAKLVGGFERQVIEGTPGATGLQLRLSADRRDLERLQGDADVLTGALAALQPSDVKMTWCLAELSQDSRSLYRALVYTQAGSLDENAGSDLGTYVGARLALYSRTGSAAGGAVSSTPQPSNPPARPSPPHDDRKSPRVYAAWAVLSPGLPWLADETPRWDRFGLSASVTDVAVLLGAALSYSESARQRNQFSERPDETQLLTGAQRFRELGNGLLITAGAMRVLATAAYFFLPPTRKLEGPTNAGSYSVRWTF